MTILFSSEVSQKTWQLPNSTRNLANLEKSRVSRSLLTLIILPDNMVSFASALLKLLKRLLKPSRMARSIKSSDTNQKIRETWEEHSTTSMSRTSHLNGVRNNSNKNLNNMEILRVSLDMFTLKMDNHLLSFALKTQRVKIRKWDQNVLWMPSKNLTERNLMKIILSTLRKLLKKLKEQLKRRKKCLDTKTQRRDATCMLKISPLRPLKNNLNNYSVNMVLLKVSRSSLKRKATMQSMLSFALRSQKLPSKPNKLWTNSTWEVNNSTSIITKLKKLDKSKYKILKIRLTSKNKRKQALIWTKSPVDQKSCNS